jgi:hypothetical protein
VGLSPEARKLLGDPIDSVESLELLFLLRRSPNTFWTADAAAQQTGIRPQVSSRKLAQLADAKLLVRGRETGAYRFAPAGEALPSIDELADEYAERRAGVINAIYSASEERLLAFSDAFRFTKE